MGKYRKNILLAEDDPALISALAGGMDRRNLSYDVTNNGHMALEKLTKTEYDLILLDILMPIMDGIAFLEKYKGVAPVYILTNFDMSNGFGKKVRAFDIVKGVYAKTMSINKLLDEIRQIITNKIADQIKLVDVPTKPPRRNWD